MLHGFMLLNQHTGALLFSRRDTYGFGLPTKRCAAAADDMRLSAMLFAVHLNATSVCADEPAPSADGQAHAATPPLVHQLVGDVRLHFCVHAPRDLLLVLAAPAALGLACADFLASALTRHFAECFAAQLDAGGAGQATPRSTFRKRAFAPRTLAACAELPPWALARARDAVARTARDGSPPAVRLAAAHVGELRAGPAMRRDGGDASPRSPPRKQLAEWAQVGVSSAPAEPRPDEAPSPPSPRPRPGLLCCCGRAGGSLTNARRPAPHPPRLAPSPRGGGQPADATWRPFAFAAGAAPADETWRHLAHAALLAGDHVAVRGAGAFCHVRAAAGSPPATPAADECDVLLVRGRLLRLATVGASRDETPARVSLRVAAAVDEWVAPLQLALDFLHAHRAQLADALEAPPAAPPASAPPAAPSPGPAAESAGPRAVPVGG